MNAVWKVFLSMSFSGSLLILALFAGKSFLKDKVSRQWQYYIWLLVMARLLFPFGTETSLLGKTYQAVEQAVTENFVFSDISDASNTSDVSNIFESLEPASPNLGSQSETLTVAVSLAHKLASLLVNDIWPIWLLIALMMLVRKITVYQSFIKYVKAGLIPVSNMELLDQLSAIAEQAGVRRAVELCVNPLVSTPMLIGFYHPCIVLPSADIPKQDFQYILLHELTHCKRQDMLYKWLVQVTVCLHWFNPLVHLMGIEIAKSCEFSCDEAILMKAGYGNAQDYGKTLLNAMASAGKYKESPSAVTLSENKQLLKERLGAIMEFKGQTKLIKISTAALTLCVALGAVFVGIYSVGFNAGSAHALNISENARAEDVPDNAHAVNTPDNVHAANAPDNAETTNFSENIQGADIPEKTYAENALDNAHATVISDDSLLAGVSKNGEKNDGSPAYGTNTLSPTLQEADNVDKTAQKPESSESKKSRNKDIYSASAKQTTSEAAFSTWAEQAEQYYKADSLPLFQIVFSRLDDDVQNKWLDRIYADGKIAFFSVAVSQLIADDPLIAQFAEKFYQEHSISFFSVVADEMGKEALETYLSRALEDKQTSFQAVLFDKLDRKKEWDELEKELAKKQLEDYQAAGVTKSGKNYCYQGQLVNLFLDIRPNKSFYTLDINPAGEVNIKIIRSTDGEITGVSYMTDAEVTELLGDMKEDDEE